MTSKEDSKNNILSLGLFVGTGECNAKCKHCAGIIHRKYAPKNDGVINEKLFYNTLKSCYEQGSRSLSITSGGEPTLSPLSVTLTLELVQKLELEGMKYDWVNLYSNGIKIGEEEKFSEKYLPLWQGLGLKTVYITVHNLDLEKNAEIYNVGNYPSLDLIVSRIHSSGLLARANVVLSKNNIGTFNEYVGIVSELRNIGFDHVSAWSIRNDNDVVDDELSPSEYELNKMDVWAAEQNNSNNRIRLLRKSNDQKYQTGQKVTLFPDRTLSSSWC
ncbi:radical SAM protein [archaeon]|jgi:MoaA/NifB/PqqE/SkfB family radical SAM enzyme|nr:radical SAM protein [archaeon]MBT3450874.1 radical SAM protein [archaeon]MBT6869056.1 radical SAM protein [archaeon]MBT7193299.1 radical SAM protein [archaeon]MBT7380307.1 radical SAM protein [archaeon]